LEDTVSNQKGTRFTPKLPTAKVPVYEVGAADPTKAARVSVHPNMLLRSITAKEKP
jgi:hypothetical protein